MSSRATSVAGKVRSCHLKRVFFYVKGAFRLSCNNLALRIVVTTWIRAVIPLLPFILALGLIGLTSFPVVGTQSLRPLKCKER